MTSESCWGDAVVQLMPTEDAREGQAAAEQVADDPVVQVGGDTLVVIEH
jgi:hypothetical protein